MLGLFSHSISRVEVLLSLLYVMTQRVMTVLLGFAGCLTRLVVPANLSGQATGSGGARSGRVGSPGSPGWLGKGGGTGSSGSPRIRTSFSLMDDLQRVPRVSPWSTSRVRDSPSRRERSGGRWYHH